MAYAHRVPHRTAYVGTFKHAERYLLESVLPNRPPLLPASFPIASTPRPAQPAAGSSQESQAPLPTT
ncbi:hypothetical protein GGTG_01116 [Gaeumannomyces tritici R3-111a-1]|uniref:Uncharacterized protein n=1 Tax=Gaeumannomyces tritici (strain R3-111a-1) TaxID=644352 RepID=J3NIN2_GAET3|nr:hypothetical protein GGTG_01116 [Gaeumannomyces tritici R3-111a-1]EJT81131.1 hypothetical protein GGTG_01116 [Gaeumannomyces tritici R3-111a-1]